MPCDVIAYDISDPMPSIGSSDVDLLDFGPTECHVWQFPQRLSLVLNAVVIGGVVVGGGRCVGCLDALSVVADQGLVFEAQAAHQLSLVVVKVGSVVQVRVWPDDHERCLSLPVGWPGVRVFLVILYTRMTGAIEVRVQHLRELMVLFLGCVLFSIHSLTD